MIHLIRQNYKENTYLFNKIKHQLSNVLNGNIAIEHIGSTAIPKMSGKNIIDIAVGVKKISEIEKVANKIEEMKYYRGTNNSKGEYIFFASRIEDTGDGDIHIHLAQQDSDRFNDFLVLKKYLLDHPEIAEEYTKVKYKLTKKAKNNREQYKLLKSEYMNELLIKARKYNEQNQTLK